MSKIYTRSGDLGETGLVSGKRISKADVRIDLYGELDELNSRIGFACSTLGETEAKFKRITDFLHHVQSILFDLGSNLACEAENRQKFQLPQIPATAVNDVEQEIDHLSLELEPIKNFILPGGTIASSAFHLCRTNARSVERKLVHYHQAKKEALPEHSIEYINRLSDYFFVLARFVNKHQGGTERPWIPRN